VIQTALQIYLPEGRKIPGGPKNRNSREIEEGERKKKREVEKA